MNEVRSQMLQVEFILNDPASLGGWLSQTLQEMRLKKKKKLPMLLLET